MACPGEDGSLCSERKRTQTYNVAQVLRKIAIANDAITPCISILTRGIIL